MNIIKDIGDFILNVGCKRIVTLIVVGTWSLSQLLRIVAVAIGRPEFASHIGVSQEFAYLAAIIAGSYFGISATKYGMKIQQKLDKGK